MRYKHNTDLICRWVLPFHFILHILLLRAIERQRCIINRVYLELETKSCVNRGLKRGGSMNTNGQGVICLIYWRTTYVPYTPLNTSIGNFGILINAPLPPDSMDSQFRTETWIKSDTACMEAAEMDMRALLTQREVVETSKHKIKLMETLAGCQYMFPEQRDTWGPRY